MELVDAALLADLRALDESAMPSTCQVLARQRTTVGGRTSYGEPQPVGAPVRCRLDPASGARQEGEQDLGRLGETWHGVLAVPLGTPLESGHQVAVTTDQGTTTVEVIGDPVEDTYATSRTAAVQREA